METGDEPDVSVHERGACRGTKCERVSALTRISGVVGLCRYKGKSCDFHFLCNLVTERLVKKRTEFLVLTVQILSVVNPSDILRRNNTKGVKIIK